MRARVFLVAAAAGLSGCAMLPQPSPYLSGQWGGPHISLLLEGGLGTIEYDCASGTIDTAVSAAKDGRFTATGTHRPGHSGPIRVGQIFTSVRATYAGTVEKTKVTPSGKLEGGTVEKTKMTLTGKLEDGTVLGPFTLTQGEEGQLTRCL